MWPSASLPLIACTVSALWLVSPNALAQKLSFGVVAGGSITKDFAPQFSPLNPNVPSFHSESQSYVIGPMVEYAFTESFSVEASSLNKLLHATGSDLRPDGTFRATDLRSCNLAVCDTGEVQIPG
jgi:hypothetical protein